MKAVIEREQLFMLGVTMNEVAFCFSGLTSFRFPDSAAEADVGAQDL